MPTYDFECSNCGEISTRFLKISEMNKPTEEPCTKCNEMKVERVIKAPHFGGEKLRADGGFRELITDMKRKIPHNTIPDY